MIIKQIGTNFWLNDSIIGYILDSRKQFHSHYVRDDSSFDNHSLSCNEFQAYHTLNFKYIEFNIFLILKVASII